MRTFFSSVALLVLIGVSGCATAPPQAESPAVSEAEVTPAPTPAEPGPSPEPLSPELLYRVLIGEIAGQRGMLEVAVAQYLAAAELTDDPRVAQRATRIAIFARDNESALNAARRWVALAPDDLEAHQALAALTLHAGLLDEAVESLEKLLEASDASGEQGFLTVSNLLGRQKDLGAALEAMEALVQRHPESPEARFAYARLALQADQATLALEQVEQCLQARPDWIDAQVLKSRILVRSGEVDQGLAVMAKALAQRPDDVDLRLNYARLLVEFQRHDEARAEFRILVNQAPDNADVIYALALLSMESEQWDDAQEYLIRLLELGDREDEAHYYLGRIAEARGQTSDGIRWYSEVSGGEYRLDALVRSASLMAQQGNIDAARQVLRDVRAHNPRLASRLYVAEGEILREAERYEEAMALFDEALKELPGDKDILYTRALTAEKLDRLDILEQDLHTILAEDPENAHALNALGYTLADRTDRYQEALGYIEKALALLPEDPSIIDSMGWVQYRLGNYEEAQTYLRKALALTEDSEIAAHLGEVLWMMGNHEEARKVWDEALQKDPDSKVLKRVMERFTQ